MSEQKFKISEDQNTLTINNPPLAGAYKAVRVHTVPCSKCNFYIDLACFLGGGKNALCTTSTRKDGKSIFWQKAKSKQDDKKATAVFSGNETVLTINGHSEHDGTYEARQGLSCDNCFFGEGKDKNKCSYNREIFGNSKCNSISRKDTVSIFWIKQEESKMTQKPEPQKRKHYDLIKKWAEDSSLNVWYWNGAEWGSSFMTTWTKDHYAIGEKPTTPPTLKATVKISLDTTELTIELPIGSRKEEIEKAILDKAVQFISHDYEFDK